MTMQNPLKVFEYSKCSTCRKARQWLDRHNIEYQLIPVRDTPPTTAELSLMLESLGGNIRKMINTSSQDYRDAGLKERIDSMAHAEIFALLRGNGNLVKRPFVLGRGIALTGFREAEWDDAFRKHGLIHPGNR